MFLLFLCTRVCTCKALPLFFDLLTQTANNTIESSDIRSSDIRSTIRRRQNATYHRVLPAPEVVLKLGENDAIPSIFFRLGQLPKQVGLFQLVWVRNPADPSQTTCLTVLHDARLAPIPQHRPKLNNSECDERGWPFIDSFGNKTCTHPAPCARFSNDTFPVLPFSLSYPDATSGQNWGNEMPSGSQDARYLLFSTVCWVVEGSVLCDWAAASAATLIQVSAIGAVSVLPLQEEMVQLSPNGCIHYNRFCSCWIIVGRT